MKKSNNPFRGIPKILKINQIDSMNLKISVLFSNGDNRLLDFQRIFNNDWKIKSNDIEYPLMTPSEFEKVALVNNTLTWKNIPTYITNEDGKKQQSVYDVGADILYGLSDTDTERTQSVGQLFKSWRKAAKLTQDEVANKAGISRSYISKLENDTQAIELKTLSKIVEASLGKKLVLSLK